MEINRKQHKREEERKRERERRRERLRGREIERDSPYVCCVLLFFFDWLRGGTMCIFAIWLKCTFFIGNHKKKHKREEERKREREREGERD